jgi:hypothetical protein
MEEYDLINEKISKMNIVLDSILENIITFHSLGLEIEEHEKYHRDAWRAENRELYNTILDKCKNIDDTIRLINKLKDLNNT